MALLFSLPVLLTLVSADVVDRKECIMCELEDWTFLSRACAAPENLLGLGIGLCVSVVFCVLPLVAGVGGVSPPNFCITGLCLWVSETLLSVERAPPFQSMALLLSPAGALPWLSAVCKAFSS